MEEQDTLRLRVQMFIDLLRADNAVPISAPFVAAEICKEMPHADVFVLIEQEAVYRGVSSVAREVLRDAHNREYDEQRIGQEELDLPEASLLNGGYSVIRDREPIYVPRLQLTRKDVDYVCARFESLSRHFARHARALRAEFERRNSRAA